ncbi:MAG: response regulator [Myxococcota bacterium]
MRTNGVEALRWLRKETAPALILLDLMMPHVSGTMVCLELRRDPRWRKVPIIITSAMADHPDVKDLVDHAVAILPKPVDLARLLAVAGDHLAPRTVTS